MKRYQAHPIHPHPRHITHRRRAPYGVLPPKAAISTTALWLATIVSVFGILVWATGGHLH